MKRVFAGTIAFAGLALAAAMPAQAADNVMKTCGAQYQAAKTAGKLPSGQTWNQYLAQCRAGMKTAPAPATPAASAHALPPAAAPAPVAAAKPASHLPGAQSPAMVAMHDRQRQCGAQWKTDKAAGKTGTQTWPQYWSACNKRLKG